MLEDDLVHDFLGNAAAQKGELLEMSPKSIYGIDKTELPGANDVCNRNRRATESLV